MDRHRNFHSYETNAALKVSQLERRWQKILEEERRSCIRNRKLLEDFDRVQKQIEAFSEKNERLKQVKHDFEAYVHSVYPKWSKELKRLQEAKKRIPSKDVRAVTADQEYNKQKTSYNNLHGGTTALPNNVHPTATSYSPYKNGINSEDTERLPFSSTVRDYNQAPVPRHVGYDENHPYNMVGYSSSHLSGMGRDDTRSWIHPDSISPSMLYHPDIRYPLPRQPYGNPRRGIPHPYGHPSHMFDPERMDYTKMDTSYHSRWDEHSGVENGQLGYPRNYQNYKDTMSGGQGNKAGHFQNSQKFHRNSEDETGFIMRTRNPQGYDMIPGQNRKHPRPEIFQGQAQDDIGEDTNYCMRSFASDKKCDMGLSFGKVGKERLVNESGDVSPELKIMADGRHNEENALREDTGSYTGHRKMARNVGKKTYPGHKEFDEQSGEVTESGNVGFYDEYSNGSSLENKGISSLSERENARRQKMKGWSGPNSKGSYNTGSVSLPTLHQFEGDIHEIYSDSPDTKDVLPTDQVQSKSDHINSSLPIDHKAGSMEQKDVMKGLKYAVKRAEDKAKVEQLLNQEAPSKEESKTSAIDDLLGDSVSDFEVSGSDVSDNGSGDKLLVNNDEDIEVNGNKPQLLDAMKDAPSTRTVQESNVHRIGNTKEVVDSEVIPGLNETEKVTTSFRDHSVSKEHPVAEGTNLSAPRTMGGESLEDKKESFREPPKVIKNDLEVRDVDKKRSLNLKHDDNTDENTLPVPEKEDDVSVKRLLVDEKTFLVLLDVVDNDIEVSFSTELLYRNPDYSVEKREEILRAARTGESLECFDPAVISMVVLDQLPYLVRSCDARCLIPEEVLKGQKEISREKDLRSFIDGSLNSLWKHLFPHFLKLMQNSVMNAEKIAGIFAPQVISSECSLVKEAVDLLARILSCSHEGDADDETQNKEEEFLVNVDVSPDRPQEDQNSDERSKSGILEELSFSSEDSNSEFGSPEVKNNSRDGSDQKTETETKENVHYSEDFEEEKSIPLTETDAYQKMLSSVKVSDEDDSEDDLVGKDNISKDRHARDSQQDINMQQSQQSSKQQTLTESSMVSKNPTKSNKPKPKLSLFSGGEGDDLGSSFGNESQGVLSSSWKSSEVSVSPSLSPDMDGGGYVPTVSAGRVAGGLEKTEVHGKETAVRSEKESGEAGGKVQDNVKSEGSKSQKSKTKSRIQEGFWNHSDTESELDLQVGRGGDDDDDEFDFYS